ncbi:NOL7 protein, partial [Menura novaehollandiae]|nr:NOL7 protein [Menura novaehollandiae]
AAGKRRAPAALPSPASSSEDEADEAPEEVPFGVAREAAEAERKLVGEAARRHRELLKEKRRRHQELFAEQKVQRCPRPAWAGTGCPCRGVSARLTPLSPAEAQAAARGLTPGEEPEGGAAKQEQGQTQRQGQAEVQEKKGRRSKGARTKGNYTAVCLKDESLTGLHQQLARDFLNAQLYGPHTNRVQGKQFPVGGSAPCLV